MDGCSSITTTEYRAKQCKKLSVSMCVQFHADDNKRGENFVCFELAPDFNEARY